MPSASFQRAGNARGPVRLSLRARFLRAGFAPEPIVTALPPEVMSVGPAPGSAIERLQPVALEVVDPRERLRRAVLHARFAGGEVVEVVHDGDEFSPLYNLSERTAITGGFRYTLRRRGGWPGAPTIRPIAFNADGLEIL